MPELQCCEIFSVLDPIELLCLNNTAYDALLLSVIERSCIDSHMDTASVESVSDKRETADLSEYEEARMPPDLHPVWWDSVIVRTWGFRSRLESKPTDDGYQVFQRTQTQSSDGIMI